ncbi:MAG: EAL domain-containing protein [Spirochaetaceae bacterium]|nr:EAL domain-containing protein [Spirochaetaceae bacterium]
MKTLEKIRNFLGLNKHSDYINRYFDESNIKSGIYVSSVVILLELFMISSVIIRQLSPETRRSAYWLATHLVCYLLLFCSALALFIYSVRHIKKISTNRKLWEVLKYIFSIISIVFGIYISYMDYKKGEQFVTLMTMTIFVFCFVVWRPIYSMLLMGATYGIFFFVCDHFLPATYATKINLSIVFISILMSAINAYRQKFTEAQKDEKLEHAQSILLKLSISDEVTGIANMHYFRSQALELMHNKSVDIDKLIFLFLDVENFKILNEKYGFWEGNAFLKNFADMTEKVFKDSIVAHFSNDNFVVLTKNEAVQERLQTIRRNLLGMNYDTKLGLKVGAYKPENRECLPLIACDHARYACYSIKKHYNHDYCEYDSSMAANFQKKQYIINNIDEAIKAGHIKVYYQPVVNAANGKLCGLEALARWDDPQYGFLSPADFIQTLEEYYQIYKLDMYVVEKVCRNFVYAKENGLMLIPVSLNFSKLDFNLINLAEEVEECLKKYGVDKKLIHIEVTESTLSGDDERLKDMLKKFRANGYALWLDDFGAGYSGLNVLKEYDFDMMKIDMKFLHGFSGNVKARQILKNIISMAKELGMSTLTEGVETEEAYQFLKENGCEQIQGYLFGRPMPDHELYEKVKAGLFQLDL